MPATKTSPAEPTIKQCLREIGIGTRVPTDEDRAGQPSAAHIGRRTLYRIESGEVLGLYSAHEAVQAFLRAHESD